MLIEGYDVEVFTPPCDPGAERFAARARLRTDISPVLPYLNVTIRGAVYTPAGQVLVWKKAGHSIAFHAYEVLISNAEDRREAENALRELVDLVNSTWESREKITPDHRTRRRPTAMAVFQLLPQTNCKRCGSPTCFTFALQLAAGQAELEACPAAFEPKRAHNLAELRAMLIDAPSIG